MGIRCEEVRLGAGVKLEVKTNPAVRNGMFWILITLVKNSLVETGPIVSADTTLRRDIYKYVHPSKAVLNNSKINTQIRSNVINCLK